MRIVVGYIILASLLISCAGRKTNFTIKVESNGSAEELLYLVRLTLSGTLVVDSVLPKRSGKYILKGYTAMPDFYVIYKQPRQYINLVIKPGDDFSIIANDAAFSANYQVKGSKDCRLIEQMIHQQLRTMDMITEISEEYENSAGSPDFEITKKRIDSTYAKVVEDHRQFSIQLITENPGSLVSLMALYQQLGRRTTVFDYKRDFKYFAMVDSNLSALYPRSEAVIDLNHRIADLRNVLRLETGAKAPDMILPDSTGNEITLSSLEGHNVLLVFWASWSEESNSEMKAIAKLSGQLLQHNVECFFVSLDKTKESWKSAMESVKVQGIHVSDLQFWDSPVADLYMIEKLPLLYMLDQSGIILYKEFNASEIPSMLKEIRE